MVMSMDASSSGDTQTNLGAGSPMDDSTTTTTTTIATIGRDQESADEELTNEDEESKASGQTVVVKRQQQHQQAIVVSSSRQQQQQQLSSSILVSSDIKPDTDDEQQQLREMSVDDDDDDDEEQDDDDRIQLKKLSCRPKMQPTPVGDIGQDSLVARMRDIVEGGQQNVAQQQKSPQQQEPDNGSGDSLDNQTETNSKASVDSTQKRTRHSKAHQCARHGGHHHHHHHHHQQQQQHQHQHQHHRQSVGAINSGGKQTTPGQQTSHNRHNHHHHHHHHHHQGPQQHHHHHQAGTVGGSESRRSSQQMSSKQDVIADTQPAAVGETKSSTSSVSSSAQQQQHLGCEAKTKHPPDVEATDANRSETCGHQQQDEQHNHQHHHHHHHHTDREHSHPHHHHHHHHHAHGRHQHHRSHKRRLILDTGDEQPAIASGSNSNSNLNQSVDSVAVSGARSSSDLRPKQLEGNISSSKDGSREPLKDVTGGHSNCCPYHRHHHHHHHQQHQQHQLDQAARGAASDQPDLGAQTGHAHLHHHTRHHHNHGHHHHGHHDHDHGHHHHHHHHHHAKQRHRTKHKSSSNTNIDRDEKAASISQCKDKDDDCMEDGGNGSGHRKSSDAAGIAQHILGLTVESAKASAKVVGTSAAANVVQIVAVGSTKAAQSMGCAPSQTAGETAVAVIGELAESCKMLLDQEPAANHQESSTMRTMNKPPASDNDDEVIRMDMSPANEATPPISAAAAAAAANGGIVAPDKQAPMLNGSQHNENKQAHAHQIVTESDFNTRGASGSDANKRTAHEFTRSQEGDSVKENSSNSNSKQHNKLVRQASTPRDSGGGSQKEIGKAGQRPQQQQQSSGNSSPEQSSRNQRSGQPKQIVESTILPDRSSSKLSWCCCCPCSSISHRSNPVSKSDSKTAVGVSNSTATNMCPALPSVPLEEIRMWGDSFDRLMKCTDGRKVFQDFLRCEYSEENILFWIACEELKSEKDAKNIANKARDIYEDYISILSAKEVSLDSRVRDIINNNIKKPTSNIFDEAQLQIYTLMHRDSYPRFINSLMYKKLAQIQTSSRKGSS